MMDEIIIFYGSKRDFDTLIAKRINDNEKTIAFMEMIQQYNARIRPNESAVREAGLAKHINVDNCIVRTDDYGSVLDHVISNFVNIISLNHNVRTLYVQNPPKKVARSLEAACPNAIEYANSTYKKISVKMLKDIYRNLNNEVLGQETCKKDIISGLYRLTSTMVNRPVVLMLYGPSGVGKTETAKSISKSLGGALLRIQFSMMQTMEAFNYIFGAEHSKNSFARDMISRESNVILIDEFDKVDSRFYNAFYELFDEGKYVDTNYEVDLHNAIFLCTGNYKSEEEIKKELGPAMYSRMGCCIAYEELSSEQKREIITKWYHEVLSKVKADERTNIYKTDILEWFYKNADRYDNIRILKTKLEKAIFDELTDLYIISGE